ncbi:Uncharacterised protein [Vibrio cholerae]|nr:Uncharacterised protein [Vibrio cholerae]
MQPRSSQPVASPRLLKSAARNAAHRPVSLAYSPMNHQQTALILLAVNHRSVFRYERFPAVC